MAPTLYTNWSYFNVKFCVVAEPMFCCMFAPDTMKEMASAYNGTKGGWVG